MRPRSVSRRWCFSSCGSAPCRHLTTRRIKAGARCSARPATASSLSRGGELYEMKRWFLIGLAVIGDGLVASGVAPNLIVAMLAFALTGLGNGLVLVYER